MRSSRPVSSEMASGALGRGISGGGAVPERLGESADDRQGRAQVVTDIGQQLSLSLACRIDLGGHGVEGSAGVSHLGGAGRRQRLRHLARSHRLGGSRQPAQRTGDRVGSGPPRWGCR